MSVSNKNKHLTAEERLIILTSIQNGATKVSIANVLGKDKSTIGKEIKLHRVQTSRCPLPLECSNYKKCSYGRLCNASCPDFIQFKCPTRDRSPGVCNGCAKQRSCRFDKFKYQPDIAHKEYLDSLVNTRIGINMTIFEVKQLGELLKPLLDKGQSVYHILKNNPKITLSERTIYSYIESGVFQDVGIEINNMILRRKVGRKLSRVKKQSYKKRQDRSFLKNRLYKDYLNFMEDNPNASIVEMDTVYNDGSNGPFIQTFKFVKYGFIFAFLHKEKTAQSMTEGVSRLEEILGQYLFRKYVNVILTDRGSEFSNPTGMETASDGTRRTYVFYCDPMCSHQKGSIENNHIELRYILPKGTDLISLGLNTQEDLNKVLSHINSFSKEKLGGKSPIEVLSFYAPELLEKFLVFGIEEIKAEDITLKPFLLKK